MTVIGRGSRMEGSLKPVPGRPLRTVPNKSGVNTIQEEGKIDYII